MVIIEFIISNILTLLALMSTGAFAGFLAGLLGVGGGIIIVPVLFFLFKSLGVSPESAIIIATATSLATIVPTSMSSILSHHQKGNVDSSLIKRWAGFILIGVFSGSFLVTRIDGILLTLLFGVIAVLSALNMLFRAKKSALFQQLPSRGGQIVMGISIGFLSSMVGIGGGTISVPLLTLYNYPTHKAVGTSAAIGFIISLPGALTMLVFGVKPTDAPPGTFGFINCIGFLCIVPFTVLFAPIGASLGAQLNAVKLKKLFALALLLTGFHILTQFFRSPAML